MIKGILFDKDGTLIEFEDTWHKIFKEIFRTLQEQYGLSKAKTDQIKEISGFLEDSFKKESLIQYATVDEITSQWEDVIADSFFTQQRLKQIMEEHSKDSAVEIAPMPGAIKTVKSLYNEGYILGLATADSKESTLDNLKRLGIKDCFHFIGSDDGFYRGKPDPHMGESFCEAHGMVPEEVLYVGDSVTDMVFAEECGFHFIGIKGTNNSWEEFRDKGYLTVKNLNELETLI